jgi:hypothetical protein
MTDADIGQLQETQDWLNEGRIDAVSTADDWRDTVNSYNQDALTESERHPHGCDCDECQEAWRQWTDGQGES